MLKNTRNDFIVNFKKKDRNNFFGYYDYSPISKDDRFICYLSYNQQKYKQSSNILANINVYDLKNHKENKVATTNSFNFQDGCRMQWFKNENKFIYNTFEDNILISKIYNANNDSSISLDYPIYELCPNGKYAITINFKEYSKIRSGYGYYFGKRGIKINTNDLFLIDIKLNTLTKIIELDELKKNIPIDSMDNAYHYIENIKFNKNGDQFYFFHRWNKPNTSVYTRVYIYNLNLKKYHCILDSGKATHLCWYDNNTLFGWLARESSINDLRKANFFNSKFINFLKKIYHLAIPAYSRIAKNFIATGFFFLDLNSKKLTKLNIPDIAQDGHPSWNPVDRNILLCDTYAEEDNLQKLFIYNKIKNKTYFINKFKTKIKSGSNRCDLHPRWSFSGKKLSFDLYQNGFRDIIIYDYEKIVNEKL